MPTNAELSAAGSDRRSSANSCVRTVPRTPARKMSNRSKNVPIPVTTVAYACVGIGGSRFSRAAIETGRLRPGILLPGAQLDVDG
jgi:hypothetical protein